MKTFKEFLKESSTKEIAEEVRNILKKTWGLTSSDVSVKAPNVHSVKIDIKTTKALQYKSQIEGIGDSKSNYSRDIATGEILMGGNTFIFTDISRGLGDKLEKLIQDEYVKNRNKIKSTGDRLNLFNGLITVQEMSNGSLNIFVKSGSVSKVRETDSPEQLGRIALSLINALQDDNVYSVLLK